MKSKYPKVMAEVLFKPMINWVTGLEPYTAFLACNYAYVVSRCARRCRSSASPSSRPSAWAPATR